MGACLHLCLAFIHLWGSYVCWNMLEKQSRKGRFCNPEGLDWFGFWWCGFFGVFVWWGGWWWGFFVVFSKHVGSTWISCTWLWNNRQYNSVSIIQPSKILKCVINNLLVSQNKMSMFLLLFSPSIDCKKKCAEWFQSWYPVFGFIKLLVLSILYQVPSFQIDDSSRCFFFSYSTPCLIPFSGFRSFIF